MSVKYVPEERANILVAQLLHEARLGNQVIQRVCETKLRKHECVCVCVSRTRNPLISDPIACWRHAAL